MKPPAGVSRPRRGRRLVPVLAFCLAAFSATVSAQEPQPANPDSAGKAAKAGKGDKALEPAPLFRESRPVEFTLTMPWRQLRRERTGTPPYRPGRVSYTTDSGVVSMPVRLRTRGIWRRKNCEFPPLLMNFTKDSTKKSLFAKLDRLRLSPHCRDQDIYEEYVLQEYQLYRVQRLLTPLSFDARLARVTYLDADSRDTIAKRWAFLQETDEAFASRMSANLVTLTGAAPSDLDPYEAAFTGVFQYFVGNSDFSISGLHNIVLLAKGDTYIAVARDFDWSGAVNTRYAAPNPVLPIRNVRQRIMRGYCVPPEEFEKVFALFREKKDAIYALYADSIGTLMNPKTVRNTLDYFDEFYRTINDPRQAKREIVEACLAGSA